MYWFQKMAYDVNSNLVMSNKFFFTNCFAVQVQKGTSAVAECDGGVRLDVLGDVSSLKTKLGFAACRTEDYENNYSRGCP